MLPGPAAAQARLDGEIAALTLVLCKLRAKRNSFSSISRLPPETLAYIFIQHAQSDMQNPLSTRGGIPEWVNVSYVCRHWRDIALNCSTLWSCLLVFSDRWTNELLARSKTSPLKVRMDYQYPNQPNLRERKFLEKIASHAHRIRELSLGLTYLEAKSLAFFSSSAPILQTLRISVEDYGNGLQSPVIPSYLFNGNTPVLRELELGHYAFRLTSSTLCGLTHLRLRDLDASCQPTLGELKTALNHMHDLEHLHLENALPSVFNSGNSIRQSFEDSENLKLSFPRLSRLSIIAPFSTVILLLSAFDLPLKTEIRLRCLRSFEARDDDEPTRIVPHLAKRLTASNNQALEFVPIIRTCFIEAASITVSFVFSTTEADFGRHTFSTDTNTVYARTLPMNLLREDWDCNIPLKFDVFQRSAQNRQDLIESMYRSIPLTKFRSAQINLDYLTNLSSDFWIIFGHLELEHLKLSRAELGTLLKLLSISPHPPPHHSPTNTDGNPEVRLNQHIIAPALKELELYCIGFFQPCDAEWKGDPRACPCSVHRLYNALERRQAEGYGLKRLVLKGCTHIHDYVVEHIRNLGIDVDWDGVFRTRLDFDNEEDEEQDEMEDENVSVLDDDIVFGPFL